MKKSACNKGLLLPWLLKALNENLYSGLKWSDKQKKIFYILWTHKSAEQWTKTDLEPFEAWAEHKGKLHGKNEKQLKATFRCALNSKRELVEVGRTRSKRFWQFVDPQPKERENTIKRRRKVTSTVVEHIPFSSDSANNTCVNDIPSLRITPSEILESSKLPKFESICSFSSLTPPHQDSEICFNFNSAQSESHQHETNSKENRRFKGNISDDLTSNLSSNNISNSFANSSVENSCANYGTRFTPSPEHSQLKSPSDGLYISSKFQEPRTDLWQPNGWTTSFGQQDFSFNHFFSDDFDETHKILKLKPVESNQMDFIEMDHLVPVLDITLSHQATSAIGQYDCTNKALIGNNQYEQVKLDEDYLLSDDVDPEACEKIMQELKKLKQHPEIGAYNFIS